MSSTQISALTKNRSFRIADITNSWRGAMAIWTSLEKKYLPEYTPLPLLVLSASVCGRLYEVFLCGDRNSHTDRTGSTRPGPIHFRTDNPLVLGSPAS